MNLKNKRSWLYFMSTLCKMGQQHKWKKRKSENRFEKKKHIFRFNFFFHVILDLLYNLNVKFSKNVSYFFTSKVDNYFFLHYQDFFRPILTCLCPIVVTSSILIEKSLLIYTTRCVLLSISLCMHLIMAHALVSF